MKTTKQPVWKAIDTLLESMWQHSAERVGLTEGSREYNYAQSIFIRTHREAVENAAYIPSVAKEIASR